MSRSGATGWLTRRGFYHHATLCSAGLGIASELQPQTSPLHVADKFLEAMASPRNLTIPLLLAITSEMRFTLFGLEHQSPTNGVCVS